MTYKPFREYHLLQFFQFYEENTYPLDYALNQYFRKHKALGSKDRAFLADTIFGMIRWKRLLDAISGKPASWEERFKNIQNFDPAKYLDDQTLSPDIRCSFPKVLYQEFVKDYGEEKALKLCLISNTKAPTTVRANELKITRNELLSRWKESFKVSPCKSSSTGIQFQQRIHFSTLPEFDEGLFEVQDEGSQLLANLVNVKPGQLVLDFCAGSGGKSLAIAPKMQGKGQLFLHDIRPHILTNARKRLKRAGVQNAQFLASESPQLKKLRKKMDWVLVDAPCSGTGTLRRNPDMKWKLTQEQLFSIPGEQRHIFEKALSFLKPGGHIVYATCSLLNAENQDQVDHFLATYPLKLIAPPFQTFPEEGQMDGFFGAVFHYPRKSS